MSRELHAEVDIASCIGIHHGYGERIIGSDVVDFDFDIAEVGIGLVESGQDERSFQKAFGFADIEDQFLAVRTDGVIVCLVVDTCPDVFGSSLPEHRGIGIAPGDHAVIDFIVFDDGNGILLSVGSRRVCLLALSVLFVRDQDRCLGLIYRLCFSDRIRKNTAVNALLLR